MSNIGLLRFEPYYKPVLWGGNRIASFKGIPPLNEPIGESWEISGLEGYESKVAEGKLAGKRIDEILVSHGETILGQRLYRLYGNKFPLLIKFIDANKDLSIQVHPDDTLAAKRHGCWGKTELWYTLEPVDGAYIYSGLRSSITPTQLKTHIDNNSFSDVLAKYYPQRGDIFYLPAGRLHSIGAGNLLLEIQQTSDITYRVYDYNRIDVNGEKRELHIDLALDAIDFRIHNDDMRHVNPMTNRETVLKECPFFSSSLILIDNSFRLQVARYDSFRIVIATQGNGIITDNHDNEISIRQGDTILIPAATQWVDILPYSNSLEIVTAYIQ